MGKSALLGYLSDRVAGWHVARAVGVESEMELAYAGLHQLCAPMLDQLGRLPIPQRDALAMVFGRSAGAAPDRFLVGLATLTLFAEVAEQQPLACIVDDAQWLDHASAQILGFVARRLLAERIAVVCAARTGAGDDVLAGLPELSVRGLGDSDARALLLASGAGWGWGSGRTVAALAASVVLLGAWVAVELRVTDPLIDLRTMSRRAVAPLYIASLPIGVAFFGATTATTTFMAASKHVAGYGFGLDVTALAYVGLATTTAAVLGAMAVPRLVKHIGHEPAVHSGCVVMLAGYSGLAAWHGALWQVIAASSVSSLGIGLTASAMAVVLTERASAASTGISIGLYITVRAIGGSMAGAGFAALLTRATIAGTVIPLEWAYVAVWLTCGLAALLSLLIVAVARPKRSAKPGPNPGPNPAQ